jgi:hypothetical protein
VDPLSPGIAAFSSVRLNALPDEFSTGSMVRPGMASSGRMQPKA